MTPTRIPMTERRSHATQWQNVALAAIAALAPTIMAAGAFWRASESKEQTLSTHQLVNSRMTEMIEVVRKQAHDAAILAERDEQAKIKAATDAATTLPTPTKPPKKV